jgi:3-deoxy-manno-octulosonate cytidylyltransferase (CMP-KDO synthetase)
MKGFHVLIPARLESSRLPEKALADLAGRPMIVRVFERACQCGALSVHVATDSDRIAETVRGFGGRVVMTGTNHDSGTSRLAEATARLGFRDDDIVVNVQGDEPALPPACVDQVASLLAATPDAEIATLWAELDTCEQWLDPNTVKVVLDGRGSALYFSRAPIPARRDGDWPSGLARRHIGLYAYRVGALRQWSTLPPSALEAIESLEQLRALEAGWRIVCAAAAQPVPPGVDTETDLQAMRRRFAGSAPG